MHAEITSNSSLRHPTDAVVRYASGETVHNLPRLQRHLGQCEECRDLALFTEKFMIAHRRKNIGTDRPSIEDVLKGAGLDKQRANEIFDRDFAKSL